MVGSIGVISARPMVEELLGKVGVEMVVSKSVQFKDMGSLFRAQTEEERGEGAVADRRDPWSVYGDRAGGAAGVERGAGVGAGDGEEVYLGSEAQAKGLVDELGTLDAAVGWGGPAAVDRGDECGGRPRRGLMQMMLQRGRAVW